MGDRREWKTGRILWGTRREKRERDRKREEKTGGETGGEGETGRIL
jgi:hypothetical protein